MDCIQERLIENLRRFIRIPSRSGPSGGEEGPLQEEIAALMRIAGARVRTFQPADIPAFFSHPLCHRPDRQYANRPTVIGELGPENAPALLILAHSDTVPLYEPDQWTVDPFGGEVRDGAVFGLGSSDDKWGLASMLGIIEHLKLQESSLRRKAIFASTIDEENGVGNGTLLLHLGGVRAEAALYLDGLRMEVHIGCLGGSNLYLRCADGVNEDSRTVVDMLQEACAALSRERSGLFAQPLFEANHVRDASVQIAVRLIEGKEVPAISFYTLPGEDLIAMRRQLEFTIGQSLGGRFQNYQLDYRSPWFEPAQIDRDFFLVHSLCSSFRNILDRKPVVTTISKQDSFVLTNHAGIPTVAFGCTGRTLGRGAFHRPDEYLGVSELWDGFRIALGVVNEWVKGGEIGLRDMW